MPRELILMGVALVFGAWMVIDQRSMAEKVSTIVLVLVVYVIFQYLGGSSSLSEIFNSMYLFVTGGTPAPVESFE